MTLNILGTIVSGSVGIDFYYGLTTPALDNTNINVGETGSVFGAGNGVALEVGINNTVKNFGSISSLNSFALYLDAGSNNSIENHGSISSTNSAGIYFEGDSAGFIINTGTITGLGSFSSNAAIRFQGGSILNSETIIGQNGIAIYVQAKTSITNSGLIMGDVDSGTVNSITVRNSGEITGTVSLSNEADDYRASGTGSAAEILMNGGSDIAFGADANDSILGGSGEDTIYGYDGDDVLIGDSNSDASAAAAGLIPLRVDQVPTGFTAARAMI